jgi:uroporphyrinogen III methyltransferase / synthase
LTDAAVPDDFFTRDLDDALLSGHADLAVHSAKDLPQRSMRTDWPSPPLLPARDIRDALVLRAAWPADQTPRVIGTSSPNRETHIRALYPDATTNPFAEPLISALNNWTPGTTTPSSWPPAHWNGWAWPIGSAPGSPTNPPRNRDGWPLPYAATTKRTELRALRPLDVRRNAGLIAIVGCPADATLLSARARSYLEQADIVIHDRLIPDDILLTIRDKAVPVGKVGGHDSTPQSEIHRRLLHESECGKLVVRLQGGDPLIFAHLSEELEFLSAWNLRVDLVPTLTAAQVAAARALAPLTHRHDGGHVHFISGHTPKGETPEPFPGPGAGNLAVYMGVAHAADIQRRLEEAGWPSGTPVLIGERLGYRDEAVRTVALHALADTPFRNRPSS